MSDNVLSAVLTFSLLIAGTAAIGSEMFNTRRAETASVAMVTLPAVTVVGHRQAASDVVMLPRVTVIGHRDAATRLAAAPEASEARRVE